MAKKEESHENPFFRGHEESFHGGELTVKSPVGSIWGDYERGKGNNVMEDVLAEQLDPKNRKSTGKGAK